MWIRLVLIALCMSVAALVAQENHTLTTPIGKPAVTNYTIRFIVLDWESKRIEISVVSNEGTVVNKVYNAATTPTGESLMVALNKADLRTNTLNMRALARLVMDGAIGAGTAGGTIP